MENIEYTRNQQKINSQFIFLLKPENLLAHLRPHVELGPMLPRFSQPYTYNIIKAWKWDKKFKLWRLNSKTSIKMGFGQNISLIL